MKWIDYSNFPSEMAYSKDISRVKRTKHPPFAFHTGLERHEGEYIWPHFYFLGELSLEVPAFDKHFLDFPAAWRIRRLWRMNIFCPVTHSERIRETLTCAQLWSLFPSSLTRSINTTALDRLHMAQRHSEASPDHKLSWLTGIYT